MSGRGAAARSETGALDQVDGDEEAQEVASPDGGEAAAPEVEEGAPPQAAGSAEPETAPGAAPPEAAPAEADLLAEVTAQRDEYLDALRRLQAEFENFRKRMARQQQESFERATQVVVERLLPALDALDLALAHAVEPPEASAEAPGVPPVEDAVAAEGGGAAAGAEEPGATGELEAALVKIANLLRDILAKEGLERIDAAGVAFDPNVHDAVAGAPGSGTGDGPAVVEVLRAGYRLRGRVLRPAMVKVSA